MNSQSLRDFHFSSQSLRDLRATMTMTRSRRSKRADIVTGAAETTREQVATLRPPRERKPMSRHARRALESRSTLARSRIGVARRISECFRSAEPASAAPPGDDDRPGHRRNRTDLDVNASFDLGDLESGDKKQYALRSVRRSEPSPLRKLLRRPCSPRVDPPPRVEDSSESVDVNALISAYISFSHRTSYFLLFLVFSLFYFGFILLFAVVYYAGSLYYPECITTAGTEIGSGQRSKMFGDSFQLSWTTFSTVGYGIVYPSTGANATAAISSLCISVGIIGSFEAFAGVLYAGFCTAVLFGKVIRSQSQAQVYFSDPMVVRFGVEELTNANVEKNSNGSQGRLESGDAEAGEAAALPSIQESRSQVNYAREIGTNIPCPSLEFRLVNRLHDIDNGEIVEAQLDCVAILDKNLIKENATPSETTTINNWPQSTHAPTENSDAGTAANSTDELTQAITDQRKDSPFPASLHGLSPKQPRVLTKVLLDANEHPFFRRVWFGRHRLDQNSPLLSRSARNKIRQNGGRWPAEWNNSESIRSNLHFRHVLVCFSGTSNANATSVYAQKVYDLVDVNVGYRFVPMNYRDAEGRLKTDSYLLNAVCEQRGGGAEQLF